MGNRQIIPRSDEEPYLPLFSDSVKGAEASAKIYTIVEMTKAHQLNPCKYLKYLLEHIPGTDMSDDVLAKHAPWNEAVQAACTGIVE